MKSMTKNQYKGFSYLDSLLEGELTKDLKDKNKVILIDKPTYSNLKFLNNFKAIACSEKLSNVAHETLLIKDFYIPLIHGVGKKIEERVGETVTFYTFKGLGVIYPGVKKIKLPKSSEKVKKYAMTSTISGMKYYLSQKAKVVATRGEFIILSELFVHPLEAVKSFKQREKIIQAIEKRIGFGAKNFEKVIYRFTDFSISNLNGLSFFKKYEAMEINPALGNRGASRLLDNHLPLFLTEIEAIKKLTRQFNNVLLLMPFVRSIKEAAKLVKIIRDNIKKKIRVGCMIEVPSMIFEGSTLTKLFDFFVIGTKDLSQLLTGSDRDNIKFDYDCKDLIAQLLSGYFLSEISLDKEVYITSKDIYNLLVSKNNKNKIYCLND